MCLHGVILTIVSALNSSTHIQQVSCLSLDLNCLNFCFFSLVSRTLNTSFKRYYSNASYSAALKFLLGCNLKRLTYAE